MCKYLLVFDVDDVNEFVIAFPYMLKYSSLGTANQSAGLG